MAVHWTLLHLLMIQEQLSSVKKALQIQDFSHPPNLQLKIDSQNHWKDITLIWRQRNDELYPLYSAVQCTGSSAKYVLQIVLFADSFLLSAKYK